MGAREGSVPSLEGLQGVDIGGRCGTVHAAVTVDFQPFCSLVDAHAAQGGGHLLNRSVGIEMKKVDADRAVFVEVGREVIVMIEQIPLSAILHHAVVIGPAFVFPLLHDDALEVPRAQWRFRHGVGQCLGGVLPVAGVAAHPGEGEVVPLTALEGERSFLETVGQSFHGLSAHLHRRHLGHSLVAGHLHLLQFAVEFQHVGFQTGATDAHATPVDIRLAVVVDQHTGVDAHHTGHGLRLADKGTLRAFGHSHADGEAPARAFRCRGEVEIILPVLAHAVGSPHGIAVGLHPGHFVLGDDDAMVGPVGQILRREHMIVSHAEPVLPLSLGGHNVVGGIEIHLIIKYPCRGVGRKLVANDGILRHGHRHRRQQETKNGQPFHIDYHYCFFIVLLSMPGRLMALRPSPPAQCHWSWPAIPTETCR